MPIGVINGLRDPFILKVDDAYYLRGCWAVAPSASSG